MKVIRGIRKRLRILLSLKSLLIFTIKKVFWGFDVANIYLQKVDKESLILILKKNGAVIGINCDIESGLVFHNCHNYSNFIVGTNCHIGKNCFFDLRDKVILKDNVVISMNCTFITHIDMSKSELTEKYPPQNAGIEIQDNVYIGANSTILMDVTINKNSFIAACSLVKTNIDSHLIVGGIPAKKINLVKNER